MKKIISILICVFILLSAVSCSSPMPPQKEQPPEPVVEQKEPYDDIISEYTALLTSKHNGEALSLPSAEGKSEREIAISETLYGIVDTCKDAKAAEGMGYAFKDMDGNGTPELILLTQYTSIKAIFTISDNVPILLEANYEKGNAFYFAPKNRFFMARDTVTGSIEEATFYTCRVVGDKMEYDAIYGKVYDQSKKETLEIFQIVNGKRTAIDEETFDELYLEQAKTTRPGYSDTLKLLSPRIRFPLKANVKNENLPIADFSSYAAIRETYKKIAVCLDKFESMKWHVGEYDDLFSFPNDLSFEYYARLLYAAYHGAYGIGYDEIDLNGDGQDELVLMNEDYRIKAIFTQKDGVPVLLDAFAYETCWLDDKGFIHVDNEEVYELEYSLYDFTRNGEYNLIYSILIADNGKRYLTKDGKTEEISFEKSLEIYYDDYCRYSEPFEPHEQTRNVSALTHTPLTAPAEDLINAAADKTWHKYAKLGERSDKEMQRSNTYLTFKNVTDDQVTLSLKYVFTFSYPDPNRENYYLDDTTETTLEISARNEGGVLVFNESGVKGRVEFGHKYLWLIIDESADQRFSVGNHCYKQYSSQDFIS